MQKQISLNLLSQTACFNGWVKRFAHESEILKCSMEFGLYIPPQAHNGPVPLIWWLSGLTCTDENFMQKAGAQRIAAELGVAIICPDTSPRGVKLAGEDDSYDFGSGAGFYLNATQAPWSQHYKMYDYLLDELPNIAREAFAWNGKQAICGHSMGGHGALVLALRNPGRFTSVSAFAPIVNPMECAWGQKAFSGYLGDDKTTWQQYDACELVLKGESKQPLLVDQGTKDNFLEEQLKPKNLEAACKSAGHPLTLNYREGYDHSYYFIATYIADHLRYHAQHLSG